MTEGIRPSAAPGRGESSSEGACLVDHPAVNEGELARGLTRDVGVVGVGCWTVAVTVSPESLQMVGVGVGGRAAPGPREAPCRGAGGVGDPLEGEGEDTGGLYHSTTNCVARRVSSVDC